MYKRQLQEALAGTASLLPVGELTEILRYRKSPEEIALMRKACAATDKAFAQICQYIRPGVTEKDIAREQMCIRDSLQAGLNANTDGLAQEDDFSDVAQTYVNVLVVKEGNEDNPAVQALAEALQSDTVRTFMEETYGGAVVPLF